MFANLLTNEIADGYLSWGDEAVQGHIEEIFKAPWLEDEEGYLYIVLDEVEGPDNEMTDTISAALRLGLHPLSLDQFLGGLTYVGLALHWFNPEDGFYHS